MTARGPQIPPAALQALAYERLRVTFFPIGKHATYGTP